MVDNFTAEIIRDAEIKRYTGSVVNLPGAHTQAETLDKLHIKLQEVIRLCLEEMTEEEKAELPKFIGTQNISVAV